MGVTGEIIHGQCGRNGTKTSFTYWEKVKKEKKENFFKKNETYSEQIKWKEREGLKRLLQKFAIDYLHVTILNTFGLDRPPKPIKDG